MKRAKQLFRNVLLMTGSALLMRGVGVAFQIYLSGRIGAEGMGLFSLLSGVYGFSLTLATSGIHLGVTRLVVDAVGKEEPRRVAPALRRAVAYALFFGILSSVLLFSFADPIGSAWLKDLRTVRPLRLLSITLPLIALSSVFSGYFVAVRRVWKNAAVQLTEQAVKIFATFALLLPLLPKGMEGACTALVLGGVCAELFSFLFHGLLYLADRHRAFPRQRGISSKEEGKQLLRITLPVAFTTYLRSGLVTLEHILIPEGLRRSGASHRAALSAYGSIQSMALPVILFPAALIQAFAGLLVPEIAECKARNGRLRLRYMIGRAFWLSLLFSIGVSGVLICFSHELGELLYPSTDAAYYIALLAPLIPIMYVDTATDAMLKGLGEQVFSMGVNVADAGISVLLVSLLIPRFGIRGYLMTIYFSELFNTSVSIARLLCISNATTKLRKWVFKPLLSVVGATSTVHLLLSLSPKAPTPLGLTFHILLLLTIYFLLLLLTGSIDREDLAWLCGLLGGKEAPRNPSPTRTADGIAAPKRRRSESPKAEKNPPQANAASPRDHPAASEQNTRIFSKAG